MTPTLEEVKKVAIECKAYEGSLAMGWYMSDKQLQAFAQHYKEEGRKEGANEILAREFGDFDAFDAHIRNNTGERNDNQRRSDES